MSGKHILGLDVGTSGCKAVVFDQGWRAVASASRRYDLIGVGGAGYEMDARVVWDRIREAVAEAHARAGCGSDGVAVSALGDVIIPLNGSGAPVRPCILDFDPRGKDEIRGFLDGFGEERLFRMSGMPPLHMNSLAKMLWIRKNEPRLFAQVRRWATFEDYILQNLGVPAAVSWSMAARTMLFDMHAKAWSPEILQAAGVHGDSLARPVPSGEVIGKLDSSIAGSLGFAPGAVACSGGHDVVCAAVGAGMDPDDQGAALDIMGTFELLIVLTRQPNLSRRMLDSLYPCYPAWHEYLSLSLNFTCGSVLDWCRDLLAGPRGTDGSGEGYGEFLKDVDAGRPGELLLVPHFAGVCNPVFNPDARGSLYGLTLNTKPRDLAQAVLEGLCYDLKSHLLGFREAGIPVERLKVVGGGARSDAWLQLKANITGMELVRAEVAEASAAGAAAFCGKAMGLVDDPYKVSSLMGLEETRFAPDPAAAGRFEEKFQRYLALRRKIGDFETG